MANFKVVGALVAPVVLVISLSLLLIGINNVKHEDQKDSLNLATKDYGIVTSTDHCNYDIIVGDGYCDDLANNALCTFDGNDCCHEYIFDHYCTKCICNLDGLRHLPAANLKWKCDDWNFIGDHICDDDTNNANCNFDGGDCCLDYITPFKCAQCLCHLEDTVHPIVQYEDYGDCEPANNKCEDDKNTLLCNYDNGDCCLPYIISAYCMFCICHEDNTRHEDIANKPYCPDAWIGDGICDDDQNIEECNFDDGDCCLSFINSNYCTECICQKNGTKHLSLSHDLCNYQDIIGDGFCDDSSNVIECMFDGGDCCLHEVINTFCVKCTCTKLGFSNPNEANNQEETCLSLSEPYIGDGICEDENNIASCDYDGGDCCYKRIIYMCTDCICHIDGTKHLQTCYNGVFHYKLGDSFCQDYMNIPECHHDVYDCCSNIIFIDECTECICHADGTRHEGISLIERACYFLEPFLGDGFCDDDANNEECEYDHGDCCLDFIYNFRCDLCVCHIDGTVHPTSI